MSKQGLDTEHDARLPSAPLSSLKVTLSTLVPPIAKVDELEASASLSASDKGACSVATEKSTKSTNIEDTRTPGPMRRRHGSGTAATAAYAGPVAERVVLGVLEKVKMKVSFSVFHCLVASS
jgi:hypothetical protein